MASQAESSPIPVAVQAQQETEREAEPQAVAGASEHETTLLTNTTMPDLALAAEEAETPEPTPSKPTIESQTQHPPLDRSETAASALLPDGLAPKSADPSKPALRITLMLTTGSRHAYTISEKYLTSRKVVAENSAGEFDPREMSGYKLKELIWTDWRPEWESRPGNPSDIRLILMGRFVGDQVKLKDLPFNLSTTNVVHMTVKPADLMDDDAEGAGGKHAGKMGSIRAHNAGAEGGAGCRCVVL